MFDRLSCLTPCVCALAVLANTSSAVAADEWIEISRPHFVVISNASPGTTRNFAWQFEQAHRAMQIVWPWARLDLDRPLVIIAVKDESSMRALAPEFWERRNGVRPASLFLTAPDRHYIVVRSDVLGDDRTLMNRYLTAYFSYVNLILGQTFGRDIPPWFRRGLAGVMSNTIVRDDRVLIGPTIPYHLDRLRAGRRLTLRELVSMTTDSVQLSDEDALTMFDAQAWAFVHFLMFERDGTYAPKLDEFARAIASGRDANVAFTQSIGDPQRLSAALANYLAAPVYSFRQINADASIPRDGLVIRAVPVAESAATIAAFHAAMRRPAEARAAIAASRKAEPNNASADVAEALLASAEGRADEARSAFAAAVAHGSTNAHAYFSLAVSMWPVSLDRERFEEIRKLLTHSVKLNSRHAAAYSALAEVTSVLTRDESGLGLARRAISLEPDESDFRLTAARVLSRVGRSADALVEARAALNLATNDVERKNAQELIDDIEAAAPSASVVDTKTSGAAVQVQEPPHTQAELMTLTESCNAGNVDACRAIVGPAETQCNAGNAWACGFAGSLHETGRGTGKADPAKAAPLYKSACDRGERRGCVSYALLLARGAGVPKDETAARSALQQACTENVPRACEFLERVFPAKK